ncbi:SoxR reducing system RseC family protein [Shewanella algidipiscicola]|uniref:Sigma E factor positive regulatory protein RseC n=1 Tax=Shewanella algidipiscicola TaxID=614070 RepID=A0ABQ4P9D4_9GAMM|nr:SoxR reducing system RseC family protein [Shewanella algidipiscicola]GIU44123.1 sigma E factor positive regulatory protein RseC [Shewanella algidipiscicola]
MMEEVATVIRNNHDGWITVEVKVKNACNHCESSESCGTSAVSKAFSPKVQRFSVPAKESYQPGELIKLGLPESVLLKAAAIVYLLPLLGLFVGASLGRFFMPILDIAATEAVVIGFGVLGGVVAWMMGRRWAKQLEQVSQPVIIARIGQRIV